MNRLIFFITMVFVSLVCLAEDIIILRTGNIIKAKVIEVNQHEVKYKKLSNVDGPLYVLDKEGILSINYSNGDTEILNSIESSEHKNVPQGQILLEPDAHNLILIGQYNSQNPINPKKQPSNKRTKNGFIYWGIDSASILSTMEFEVQIRRIPQAYDFVRKESYQFSLESIPYQILIKNKTNNPLFIDLGNTVRVSIYDSIQESKIWSDGTIFNESSSSMIGGGLSLGAITNAVGIGGIAGTLANGLSLGVGGSSGASVSTSVQRYICIPPNTIETLPSHPYLDGKKVKKHWEDLNHKLSSETRESFNLSKWTLQHFDYQNSISKVSFYITGSFDREFKSYFVIPVLLFARTLYGAGKYLASSCDIDWGIPNLDYFIVSRFDTYFENDFSGWW